MLRSIFYKEKGQKPIFTVFVGLLYEYGRICMKTFYKKKMRLDETFNLIPLLYIPKTYQSRDKCQKPTFWVTVGLR